MKIKWEKCKYLFKISILNSMKNEFYYKLRQEIRSSLSKLITERKSEEGSPINEEILTEVIRLITEKYHCSSSQNYIQKFEKILGDDDPKSDIDEHISEEELSFELEHEDLMEKENFEEKIAPDDKFIFFEGDKCHESIISDECESGSSTKGNAIQKK